MPTRGQCPKDLLHYYENISHGTHAFQASVIRMFLRNYYIFKKFSALDLFLVMAPIASKIRTSAIVKGRKSTLFEKGCVNIVALDRVALALKPS